jgi:cytidylate kinase
MSLVVAIDGPAAAGKGTLSRGMAVELGWPLLDTGRLYRAVAYEAMSRGIPLDDAERCTDVARNLSAETVGTGDFRGETFGNAASKVSCIPGVRAALFEFKQAFAAKPPGGSSGAILDGRDIGTVICPDATLKIFLDASLKARVARRLAESRAAGDNLTPEAIEKSLTERDHREATRAVSPMRPADDAVVIDTSDMTPDEVLEAAMGLWAARMAPVPSH